jgi:hypothetical protein
MGGITNSFADTMNALFPSPIIALSLLLSEYIGKGQFFNHKSTGIEQELTARGEVRIGEILKITPMDYQYK